MKRINLGGGGERIIPLWNREQGETVLLVQFSPWGRMQTGLERLSGPVWPPLWAVA